MPGQNHVAGLAGGGGALKVADFLIQMIDLPRIAHNGRVQHRRVQPQRWNDQPGGRLLRLSGNGGGLARRIYGLRRSRDR